MKNPFSLKILRCLLPLLCVINSLTAQTNLIGNGGFEDYNFCPAGLGLFQNAKGWFNPLPIDSSNPSYFNSCSTLAGVPSNVLGYQTAHGGKAYAGIYLINLNKGKIKNPYREYIGTPLSEKLVCGRQYQLTFYVAAAQKGLTTSSIQALFSNTPISEKKQNLLKYRPQIYNSYYARFQDTGAWVEVQAGYTATGNEQYLYIGNFNNDSTSNLLQTDSSQLTRCFVYIDDVSLKAINTDYCDTTTSGTDAYLPNAFTPNGDQVNDYWHVVGNTPFAAIALTVYDRWGQKVFVTADPHFKWDGTFGGKPLPQGTFFYTITYQVEGLNTYFNKTGEVNIIR